MRKGISPLVASVLLIAITIAIAGILASWVSSYTQEALPTTACIGGQVGVVSSDYPYWDGSEVIAVVEATNVPLSDFKIVVLMNDDSVYTFEDNEGLSLEAGGIGKIMTDGASDLIDNVDNVWAVQIATNCPEVKSGWYDLIV